MDDLVDRPGPVAIARGLRFRADRIAATDNMAPAARHVRAYFYIAADHIEGLVGEVEALRGVVQVLFEAMRYPPCLNPDDNDDPCDCCCTASDIARVWTDGNAAARRALGEK